MMPIDLQYDFVFLSQMLFLCRCELFISLSIHDNVLKHVFLLLTIKREQMCYILIVLLLLNREFKVHIMF